MTAQGRTLERRRLDRRLLGLPNDARNNEQLKGEGMKEDGGQNHSRSPYEITHFQICWTREPGSAITLATNLPVSLSCNGARLSTLARVPTNLLMNFLYSRNRGPY